MANVLERTRTLHEDIETAEQQICETIEKDAKSHRDRLNQQHQIAQRLESLREKQVELFEKYSDEDQSRKEEINAMGGEGPALFSLFYDKLKDMREYHRKFPDIPVTSDPFPPVELSSLFSGEEAYGRYLDLHLHYDRFVNLPRSKLLIENFKKNSNHFDYTRYVSEFYLFDDEWTSKKGGYHQYLLELLDYLLNFCKRSDPLEDIDGLINTAISDYQSLGNDFSWELIREKEEINQSPSLQPKLESEVDDELYCVYCKKKFAKKTVFDGHLKGKKHEKAVSSSKEKSKFQKEIALTEFKIFRLGMFLQKVSERTIRNIEAKQAKNWEELQADFEEESEEEISSDEEEDEDEIIQGINNYPVGWDGKPIPFWLYKLHGLGVEYKCEICGNAAYMGRRNFERHFQEWRHTQGLKCLGVSNTKHFTEITKIKDALSLHKKLQEDKKTTQWDPDEQMEFEDSHGNVVTKKTFDLMKKQGLLNE